MPISAKDEGVTLLRSHKKKEYKNGCKYNKDG